MKTYVTRCLLVFASLVISIFLTACNESSSDPAAAGGLAGQPGIVSAGPQGGGGNMYETPDPASLGMLLAGIAGIGTSFALRRKRRR